MCCPVCMKGAQIATDVTVNIIEGKVYRNKTVLRQEYPLNTAAPVYQELYLRCKDPTCTDHNGNPTRWVIEVSFLRMVSPAKPQDFLRNMQKINKLTDDTVLQRQLLIEFDNGYVVDQVVPDSPAPAPASTPPPLVLEPSE